jgi:hypothetical protein
VGRKVVLKKYQRANSAPDTACIGHRVAPMRVETAQASGPSSWVVGVEGTQSERFRRVTLTADDLAMDRRRAPFYLRCTKEAMEYGNKHDENA